MSSYLTCVFSSILCFLWITAIKAWYLYYFWCFSNIIRNCVKSFQGMLLKKLLSLFLHWPNKCWYAFRPNNQSKIFILNVSTFCPSFLLIIYLMNIWLSPLPISLFIFLSFSAWHSRQRSGWYCHCLYSLFECPWTSRTKKGLCCWICSVYFCCTSITTDYY